MSPYHYFIFIAGLVIITYCSELVLKGATRIAALLGVSPMLIGLTVVSVGTSLPELAVGLTSVKEGASDIAVGNIAGTNIVNILFILGISAVIRPLPLVFKNVRLEVLVMIFCAVLLVLISLDHHLSNLEGLIMLVLGVVYIILITRLAKKRDEIQHSDTDTGKRTAVPEKKSWKVWVSNTFFLIVGIAGTIYGAELLIESAVMMARAFQISDAVIGLTIIAIGTSLPELATTLMSTIKGENRDVAIGNLLGSSINNILFILGATSLFSPGGITVGEDILWFDLPLAALVALICYPIFKSGQIVSRKEGILMVGLYLVYLLILLFFRD